MSHIKGPGLACTQDNYRDNNNGDGEQSDNQSEYFNRLI
jgi:hypothetical protein